MSKCIYPFNEVLIWNDKNQFPKVIFYIEKNAINVKKIKKKNVAHVMRIGKFFKKKETNFSLLFCNFQITCSHSYKKK